MTADASRPRPTPPPGRTAAPRPTPREGLALSADKPLTGPQFVRLQALRVASDRYRGSDLSDEQLCASADRLLAYIRTGKIQKEGA